MKTSLIAPQVIVRPIVGWNFFPNVRDSVICQIFFTKSSYFVLEIRKVRSAISPKNEGRAKTLFQGNFSTDKPLLLLSVLFTDAGWCDNWTIPNGPSLLRGRAPDPRDLFLHREQADAPPSTTRSTATQALSFSSRCLFRCENSPRLSPLRIFSEFRHFSRPSAFSDCHGETLFHGVPFPPFQGISSRKWHPFFPFSL